MTTILWVDDEVGLIREFRQDLQRRGLDVTFAADVCSAIAHIGESGFDFYLVDVGLRRGALEAEYPALAPLLPDSATLGITFVSLLIEPDGPFRISEGSAGLCSSHEPDYLRILDAALMSRAPFLNKITAFLSPSEFIDQLSAIVGQPIASQAATSKNTSADQVANIARNQHAEGLSHDYRNLVLPCISSLRSISQNLAKLLTNDPLSDRGLAGIAQAGFDLAEQALDTLTDRGQTSSMHFEKANELQQQLKAELAHISAAKLTLVSGLLSDISFRLSKLPATPQTSLLAAQCREITIAVCMADLERVSNRLRGGLAIVPMAPDSALLAEVDTSEVVKEAIALNEVPAQNRRQEFRLQVAPHLKIACGDRAAYFRLIINILENAVKYNGQMRRGDAWIEVRHYLEGAHIITEVESWGPEIAPDERDIIFQRGLRGSNANRSGKGLGLAIAVEEAAKLGGCIEQTTRPRRGRNQRHVQSIFKVIVPQETRVDLTSGGTGGI